MYLYPVIAQVGDMACAGYAGQKRAVCNRCKDFTILGHKDICCRGFGNIAHTVGNQRVAKPFAPRLGQHAGIVGIQTPRLGVQNRVV